MRLVEFRKFMKQDKKLLERGVSSGEKKRMIFFTGLNVVDVEFLLDPMLKFCKLFFLLSFRNTGLTTGKEITR